MKNFLLISIMFMLIINLGLTITAVNKVVKKSNYTSCKQDEDIGGGECKEA